MEEFILKKGERALFSYSLDKVKSIYNNSQIYLNPYKDLNINLIIKDLMDLKIFRHLYLSDLRNYNLLFKLFKELFLFVDKDFAFEWENNLKWESPNLSVVHKSSYNLIISKNKASLLYLADDQINEEVWRLWFNENPSEVLNIVNFSIKKLEELSIEYTNKINSPLFKNIHTLSSFFNLNDYEKKVWASLCLLMYTSEVNNELMKQKNNWKEIIFDIASEVLNVDNLYGFINKKDNFLFENNIIHLNDEAKIWKEFFINEINIDELLYKCYLNDLDIIDDIVKKVEFSLPEYLNYSYLQEYVLIDGLLSNIKNNISLVIQGSSGIGKKTLLGYFCQKKNIEVFIANNKNEKLVQAVVKKKNGLLLVSGKSIEKVNKALCSRVFCIEDATSYNKNIDLIVKMSDPNLEQRIMLSLNYFKDKDTAIKVSQRVKSISEIYQIYNFCKKINNFNWSYIQLLISNFGNVKAKGELGLEKWEISKNVVSFFGNEHLKNELSSLIKYFNEPSMYLQIGAKAKKGVLLVGPPGSGKTHFVKNLAKEINVAVYSINSSLLVKDLSLIPRVFDFLKSASPCVLFIDEIDTLISYQNTSNSLSDKSIVNSFLMSMDGLESNEGVLVIGSTSKENSLDSLALRSGRFDTVLNFSYPSPEERSKVWGIYLQTIAHDKSISVDELALLSDGFSCSEVAEAVNKASLMAVKNSRTEANLDDFKKACEVVSLGSDVQIPMSKETLLSTCYHEAGHVIAIFHSKKFICDRVIVRPKKSALGLTSYIMKSGDYDNRLSDLYKKIQIAFGGMVAEELVYGENTTGVSMDMSNAYDIAKSIINTYSMHPEFLGNFNLSNSSEKMKSTIEEEIQKILRNEYDNTKKIMSANRELLDEVAKKLFIKHEISGIEILELSKKIKFIELNSLFVKKNLPVKLPEVQDVLNS